MDEIAPQIALLRQMYMGLDKKSRLVLPLLRAT